MDIAETGFLGYYGDIFICSGEEFASVFNTVRVDIVKESTAVLLIEKLTDVCAVRTYLIRDVSNLKLRVQEYFILSEKIFNFIL